MTDGAGLTEGFVVTVGSADGLTLLDGTKLATLVGVTDGAGLTEGFVVTVGRALGDWLLVGVRVADGVVDGSSVLSKRTSCIPALTSCRRSARSVRRSSWILLASEVSKPSRKITRAPQISSWRRRRVNGPGSVKISMRTNPGSCEYCSVRNSSISPCTSSKSTDGSVTMKKSNKSTDTVGNGKTVGAGLCDGSEVMVGTCDGAGLTEGFVVTVGRADGLILVDGVKLPTLVGVGDGAELVEGSAVLVGLNDGGCVLVLGGANDPSHSSMLVIAPPPGMNTHKRLTSRRPTLTVWTEFRPRPPI